MESASNARSSVPALNIGNSLRRMKALMASASSSRASVPPRSKSRRSRSKSRCCSRSSASTVATLVAKTAHALRVGARSIYATSHPPAPVVPTRVRQRPGRRNLTFCRSVSEVCVTPTTEGRTMHDELAGPGQARHDAPETSKTAAKLEQGPLRYRVLARFAEAGNNGLITIEAADLFPEFASGVHQHSHKRAAAGRTAGGNGGISCESVWHGGPDSTHHPGWLGPA